MPADRLRSPKIRFGVADSRTFKRGVTKSRNARSFSGRYSPDARTKQLDALAPTMKSSRKSILALSVLALGLNATAAVYTLSPSDFALPNVSSLAELLPHQKAFDPTPDPVVAALKDIQSAQQTSPRYKRIVPHCNKTQLCFSRIQLRLLL